MGNPLSNAIFSHDISCYMSRLSELAKLSLVLRHHSMKTDPHLNLVTIDGGECVASRSVRLTPVNRLQCVLLGNWLRSGVGRHRAEKT